MPQPVSIHKLTRYYGEHRGIIDVSFNVDEGSVFGFLGPNGAGKTTLIRHLLGILKPSSGEARIFGHDCWAERATVTGFVGFLPSDIQFQEHMTAQGLLDFYGQFRPESGYRERMAKLAERFALDLSRSVHELSSGNRQKVGLVQAFMHDAPLLILDEPTTGLDPLMQQEFLTLVGEERERGKTIFLSSHDLHEVDRVATHVGLIRGGELATVDRIDDVRARQQRRMEIMLAAPASLDCLRQLATVQDITQIDADGLRFELRVSRPLGPVLKALAGLPVEDLIYGVADLESVFIHYYNEPADAEAET